MARKKADVANDAPAPATEAEREYTVVARRYRPKGFDELVGQEAVVQALGNAIKSGRVAHAYLFTGARGVGKTSTARILAKCLNCVTGPTATPCNVCELCLAIAAGEDVDVLEIDGASNRGIDEVREIRNNVQYRPQRGRYKIYIIDEVHMLTQQAFNALLKTLEEPPSHVKFFFATTEANKIPITILSRCQRFDFAGINMSQLKERLAKIVEAEGMKADPEAIELIARRAGGSMRDGQSLLDQLLAFGGDGLTVERVHALLGTAGEERVAALASAALANDPRRALELVAEAAERGLQLGELLDQLIDYWRDLMVVQAAGVEGQTLSVTGANRDALKGHASRLSPDTVLAGLDVLVAAKSRMRGSSHGRILVEMALLRLSRLDDLASVSQLVQWLQDGGAPSGSPGPRPTSAGAVRGPEAEKKKLTGDAPPPASAGPMALSAETLPGIWAQVVGSARVLLTLHLRSSLGPAISGPNSLVLRFPRSYNLPDEAVRAEIEALFAAQVAGPVALKFEQVAAPEGATRPREREESPMQKRRRHQEEVLKAPLLAKMKAALGATVIDMEEGFAPTASSPASANAAKPDDDRDEPPESPPDEE